MITGLSLSKIAKIDSKVIDFPYHGAIGTLNYIAQCTRPDILFAVTYLSRYCNTYDSTHVQAVKRIFRYLQGTKDYAIRYDKSMDNQNESSPPIGFSNADWGNISPERRSISGVVYIFCGGPISWSARTQKCVALSSTEAELNALSEAGRQALYLRKHFDHLGIKHNAAIEIFTDSQSALTIVKSSSGTHHGRLKHYDIKIEHLRDESQKGKIVMKYCPTNEMPSDLLTKALSKAKTNHLSELLHLGIPIVK